MKLLKQIWKDIHDRENIELYITILVSLSLVIAGIIGVVDFRILASGILATLTLVAMGLIGIRHTAKDMQEIMVESQKRQERFLWRSDFVMDREALRLAETIDWISISLRTSITIYKNEIGYCLESGGKVRILLLDPDRIMLNHSEKTLNDINVTITECKKLVKSIPDCKLEVRYLVGQPPYRMLIVNRNLQTGVVGVRLNKHPNSKNALMFRLNAIEDATWFGFFLDQFEMFWQDGKRIALDQ